MEITNRINKNNYKKYQLLENVIFAFWKVIRDTFIFSEFLINKNNGKHL